jgi:hypothetical protein
MSLNIVVVFLESFIEKSDPLARLFFGSTTGSPFGQQETSSTIQHIWGHRDPRFVEHDESEFGGLRAIGLRRGAWWWATQDPMIGLSGMNIGRRK